MEKLRKFCVALFGGLSVFFAVVAARNHYFSQDPERSQSGLSPWNAELERAARTRDKLVFFSVAGAGAVSKKARKQLEKYYVFSSLDKTLNPADFIVFDYFFKRASRGGESLACAILTPNMRPVYMSGATDAPKLEKLLPAAAQSYAENRRRMRFAAEAAATAVDVSETSLLHSAPLYNAIARAPTFGGSPDLLPAAVLTENARLDFMRLKAFPSLIRRGGAMAALSALKARYASEKSAHGKLLCARAMADISFAVAPEAISELRDAADKICEKPPRISTADAALALTVLARAQQIFGGEKYFENAKKIADAAAQCAYARVPVPAKMREFEARESAPQNSVASAYAVAMLANALCDFAEVWGGEEHLHAALALIGRLDTEYAHRGVWAVNSANSPSAKFARVYIADDNAYPSYIGEGYQAIKKIRRGLNIGAVSPFERKIGALANSFIPAAARARSSILIAETL